VESQRIEFDGYKGIKLVAESYGDPKAWPVLFLHGAGQTRHAWARSAEVVAQRGWRAITLDLRGHGDSQWSQDRDYSFTAFAGDCSEVVRQLDRSPAIIGASLGGLSATLAERTSMPPLSCGLVLVDITAKINPVGVSRVRSFMRSGLDGFDSLEDAALAIAAYTPNRKRPTNLNGLLKVLREREGRWYWHWDPAFVNRQRSWPEMHDDDGDSQMRIIEVPAMLVRGGLSDIVTQDGIDDLSTFMTDVSVVEVGGASHMIAGDKNDEFSSAITNFLENRVTPFIQASGLWSSNSTSTSPK
jgi:pimeloyl-ACP methyl ester carboxylesterase